MIYCWGRDINTRLELMQNQQLEEDFSYRTTKDNKVFIYWRGREVTVLKGSGAQRFLEKVEGLGRSEAQLAMAKATGNFKRGNERRQSKSNKS